LASIGDLVAVIYRSDRDEKNNPDEYIHYFDKEPILASDGDGEKLYILDYSGVVTERGIEG